MPDRETTTELILKAEVARIPLSVRGVLQDGELGEVSGSVTIEKTLGGLLRDLGSGFSKAVDDLNAALFDGRAPEVTIERLGFGYSLKQGFAQLTATMRASESGCHVIVLKKKESSGGLIVGLELRSDTGLLKSNLLSGLIGEISIGKLGVYYASAPFPQLAFFPDEAFRGTDTLPVRQDFEKRTFREGFNLSAEIRIGGINLIDLIGMPEAMPATPDNFPKPGEVPSSPKPEESQREKSSIYWISTDKTIGPLTVRRVGLRYDLPNIGISLDAGLRLSCLTFDLEGLGLSYPIDTLSSKPKEIWENLEFHLDGAAVAFQRGPLTICGGLIKTGDMPLALVGTLLVKTKICTVAAIGAYTTVDGAASFFAFAALQKELGGPPFFFITGLAFGFGVNRALKLPTINEVQNFPLVRAAIDPDYLGADLDLRSVAKKLDDYIAPCHGNFWIAAGVKFSTFGQIDSFALLSVSFGTQFEIALLGLSMLRIPKQIPGGTTLRPVACIEMALRVSFSPDRGVLACEARLTENSFVLMKEFRLRGGFAFYTWFAGDHEGDFVISVGGYHPRFLPPAHYPRPDLVEFNCVIGSVTIQGHCYFALCPSAIMAGGGLSVVFQCGGIRAWLIACADFLIQWKPLYYDIAIGVSIGVALNLKIIFRIRLSLELSASLNLYGPPLGGTARISLWIISFTVAFGEARRLPPPLQWESGDPEKSFAASFLPNPDITRVTIIDGLLREIKDGATVTRLVNPHALALECRAQVPITAVMFNTKAQSIPEPMVGGKPVVLGVRPMGRPSFYSCLTITLEPAAQTSEKARQFIEEHIGIALVKKSLPLALWGNTPLDPRTPSEHQMIDGAVVGVELRAKPGPRPWETPAMDLEVLAYERTTVVLPVAAVKPAEALPGFGGKTIANTVEDPEVVATRKALLKVLRASGRTIMDSADIHLRQMKEGAPSLFQAMPAMARVGQYPPRGYLES